MLLQVVTVVTTVDVVVWLGRFDKVPLQASSNTVDVKRLGSCQLQMPI